MANPHTLPDREIQSAPEPANGQAAEVDAARGIAVSVECVTHEYPARKPSRREKRAAAKAGRGVSDQPIGPALSDVSLTVYEGEIFGILGPNGSGKSTLFKLLATLLRPTRGSMKVFGDDPALRPADVRNHLGVVFQSPSLDLKLKAYENLLHQGHLYGLRGNDLQQRITAALQQTHLEARKDELVERFSGGMRRKLEVAKALLHHPRLLLLDEPSTGLDPVARRELWDRLRELSRTQGLTIVVSTHLMDEAERCDRLAILDRGNLVALDKPAALKESLGGHLVSVVLQAGTSPDEAERLCRELTNALGPWPGDQPKCVNGEILIPSAGPDVVPKVAELLPAAVVSQISIGSPTLEDVFVRSTGRAFEATEQSPNA